MAQAKAEAEPNIDLDSLFKLIEFKPHSEGQWEYCRSTARFNIPCCGRRWGKSQAAGHRMTYKSFVPNSYNWIVGPTYKLGEKEFRVVWQDYEKLGLLKHCRKQFSVNQGNMRIETPWKSIVEVVSAEKPDGLLGEGLSHVIMSEAARHTRDTWEQHIEPALSDLRGSADFPSTPQGYNWYHGLWMLGQSQFSKSIASQGAGPHNYKSWSFPSWENPIRYPGGLKNEEIQRLKSIASRIMFDQEYGAKFTAMTGAIYDDWDETVHVGQYNFRPDWPNYVAFDYGFANPFVALDIQVSPSDEVYVWREYYSRYVSTMEHGRILKERTNPEGYRVDGMWGDPRGADEAAILSQMIGYVASQDVSWKLGVEAIKQLMFIDNDNHTRLHISDNCPNLIRSLSQLHVRDSVRRAQDLQEQTGDGNIQHKVDDHAADALRYFVGPYFVLGAGSHLTDIYGNQYSGSESESFFTLHGGVSLDSRITL